jgi:arginase
MHVLGPLLGRLHQRALEAHQSRSADLLLTIGGDHSVGSATISAAHRFHKDLKVIWVDAHPDAIDYRLRTPAVPFSDNYHGMPLSHLTGITRTPDLPAWRWLTEHPLLDPANVVLLAIRDIDSDEYVSLEKHRVKCFTMDHIDKYGIGEVMRQSIEYLDPTNRHPFHLSFDVVGQTGTRFRYGLSARESVHIVRRLAHERRVVSMDLVEINQSLNETEPIRKRFRG